MFSQQEAQGYDLFPNGRVFDISKDRRAGPEKLNGRHIVRLPEAIRHNQFHAHPGPASHRLPRQHGDQLGNLSDELKPDDDIDLGQFNADIEPGSQLRSRNNGQDLRGVSDVFERNIGILLSDFQTHC